MSTHPISEEGLYEYVNGQAVEKTVGYYELQVASVLHQILGPFVRNHLLGRTVVEMLFQLDLEGKIIRRPDLAFVSYKRWPKDRKMRRANAWNVVPNLAVEVVSPTNTAEDVAIKIQEYFEAGVEQVWVIYSVPQQVYVHRSSAEVRILGRHEELVGGDLLPGFVLPVASLFQDELEDEVPES
jgi:Uma2 family endonuclease